MADMNKNNVDRLSDSRQEKEVHDLFYSLIENDKQGHACEQEVSPKAQVISQPTVDTKTTDVTAQESEMKGDELSLPLSREAEAIILIDHESVEDTTDEDDVSVQQTYEEMPLILTSSDDDENDQDEYDQFTEETQFIVPQEEVVEIPVIEQEMHTKRNPFAAIWDALCNNVPLPGDRVGEILRKTVF